MIDFEEKHENNVSVRLDSAKKFVEENKSEVSSNALDKSDLY